MRIAFVNALLDLARKDKNIWLLTGDLGFSVFEQFRDGFPKQYLNCGVAEASLIGTAAGVALSGKTVFAYSIIPFATMRCFEQIRDDVCLQNANVKIVGVGSGLTYGQLGPTHHSIEDIAIMRSLPNMTVICPGDPVEAELATYAAAKFKGPVYLRLGKKGESVLYRKKPDFKIGKAIILRDGSDLAIIATGSMLESAILTADKLSEKGLKTLIISMHTVKPLDEHIILKAALKTKAIFTLEEHSIIGGLGSAVSEVLAEAGLGKIKFRRFGILDKFTKIAGTQEYLKKVNGLSVDKITKSILKELKRK